jgi:hypothetical protein
MLARDQQQLLEYREVIETCERALALSFPRIAPVNVPPPRMG